jgi:PqqD family protein of HPr-rel-A system
VRAFVRAPGVLFEPLGDGWGAYSSLSGETHLLNDESVAIVEALDLVQPLSASAVCELLARDCHLFSTEVEQVMGAAWEQLIEAGLIREQSGAVHLQ